MMGAEKRRSLILDGHLSKEPEIGRWLWALQDTRQRTLRELREVTPATLDWLPEGGESTIGTILYHIADIEADWLYAEVLEQPFPPDVAALFPYATRDEQGRLVQVQDFSLKQHLERLATVRELLLAVYQPMDLPEFRRARSLEKYDVTPEWVLHHLMQHEAEHRSQIGSLRTSAERKLATR
jgi:uncharacterized damage-inducible protein DinB